MAIRVALLSKIKRPRTTRTIKSRLIRRLKAEAASHPSLLRLRKIGTAIALHRVAGLFRQNESPVQEKHWKQMLQYQPESWRDHEPLLFASDYFAEGRRPRGLVRLKESNTLPSVKEQTRVLELLGRVNYRIIKGNRVYVEVGGVVYKTLYGGYWRSVFTGIEHYLLHCEQVSGIWADDESDSSEVDLPIAFSTDGWTASGHSLSFMVSQE